MIISDFWRKDARRTAASATPEHQEKREAEELLFFLGYNERGFNFYELIIISR